MVSMPGLSVGKAFIDVLPNMGQFAAGIERGVTSPKVQRFGKAMMTKVTLPVLAAGGAAVKLATDFESSMSKITGLVGIASEQVAEWGDQILELAPKVGKAPQELADALFFVTSAGFRGAAAMDVLEISAKGAAAGLGETLSVADAVTSAVNAYGIANLSAADAADVLTATVREGKAEAASIAPILGTILPTASELGVSFHDVGAGIAAMTRTGDNAASSATKLNAIFSSLTKTTTQQRDAFKSAGLNATELREGLGEKGLHPTLMEIRDAVGGNIEAMARMFPNVRALRGVLSLTGSQAEINAGIFDSLANSTGALDDAFAAAEETASFQFQQGMAQVKSTLIGLGQDMLPMVTAAFGKLSGAFEWFGTLDVTTRNIILTIVGITAAIGPLILGIGKLKVALGWLAVHPVVLALMALSAVVVAVSFSLNATEAKAQSLRVEVDRLTTAFGAFVGEGHSFKEMLGEFETMMEAAKEAAQPSQWETIGASIRSVFQMKLDPNRELNALVEKRTALAERQVERLSRMKIADNFITGTISIEQMADALRATGLEGQEFEERLSSIVSRSDSIDVNGLVSWVNEYKGGFDNLNDAVVQNIDHAFEFGQITKRQYIQALVNGGIALDDARRRSVSFAGAQKEVREEIRRTSIFAGMNAEAFEEWAGETRESFDSFISGVTKVKDAWSVSTQEMAKQMEAQAEVARQGVEDIAALNSNKNIDPEFKAWLVDQGPAAVHAFVQGGVTEQGRMETAWTEITDATKDYGKEIGRLPGKIKTQFDADTEPARRAFGRFSDDLNRMGFSGTTLDLALQVRGGKKHSGGLMTASDITQRISRVQGDELLTVLQKGEYVVQRDAVNKPGMLNLLEQLNEGILPRYHTGGLVRQLQSLKDRMRNPPEYLTNLAATLPTAEEWLASFGGAGDPRLSPSARRALPLAQAAWPNVNFNPGIMVRGFNFGSTARGFSQHSYGNAFDQTPPSQGLADWWRRMAGPLSVANTIFAGRSAFGGGGWNNYTGSNQHYDHVHTDFSPPGRGTPPPGGGWMTARGGFRGQLSKDALFSAHRGEFVDIKPQDRPLQIVGKLTIDPNGQAWLRGVAREEIDAEKKYDRGSRRARR